MQIKKLYRRRWYIEKSFTKKKIKNTKKCNIYVLYNLENLYLFVYIKVTSWTAVDEPIYSRGFLVNQKYFMVFFLFKFLFFGGDFFSILRVFFFIFFFLVTCCSVDELRSVFGGETVVTVFVVVSNWELGTTGQASSKQTTHRDTDKDHCILILH